MHAQSNYNRAFQFRVLPHAVWQDVEGLFQLMLHSMFQVYADIERNSLTQIRGQIMIQTHQQPRVLTFFNPLALNGQGSLNRIIYSASQFHDLIDRFLEAIMMYFQSDESISLPQIKCYLLINDQAPRIGHVVGTWNDQLQQTLDKLNKYFKTCVIDGPHTQLHLCFWIGLVWWLYPKEQTKFKSKPSEWIAKARCQHQKDLPDSALPTPLPEVCTQWVRKYPQYRLVIAKESKEFDFYKGQQWKMPESYEKDPNSFYFLVKLTSHKNHPAHLLIVNQPHNLFAVPSYLTCGLCMHAYPRPSVKKAMINIRNHRCTEIAHCSICLQFIKTPEEWTEHTRISGSTFMCAKCNVPIPNEICKARHELVCTAKYIICDKCGKVVRNETHQCGKHLCKTCGSYVDDYVFGLNDYHRCPWKRLQPKKVKDKNRYFAFDFESMFEKLDENTQLHHINFIACQELGQEDVMTWSNVNTFLDWLFHLEGHKIYPLTFFAHNLKSYDGRLLFEAIKTRLSRYPDKVLWNGTKIMNMEFKTLHASLVFRDSLCHVQSALEQFPKIFGLDETKFEKGFFPYLFNIQQHQNYVGPIPAIQYFDPNTMKPEKKVKFLKWYSQQKDTYDFQKELAKYCISDVRILAESLQKYKEEAKTLNEQLNPLDSNTIAAYAMKVYRTLHMPEDCMYRMSPLEEQFARQAFHGGRTDVRCMLKHWTAEQVDKGVYGKYQDIQSLYPYVQFFKPMPVGVPKILNFTEDVCTTDFLNDCTEKLLKGEWFGFIECDLECTQYVHHPVLVCKNTMGKLTADLLPKTKITITTAECQMALQKGYVLKKVYIVHLYQKSTDLFKSYIQQYLKLKIENSGMPSWIKTEQHWTQFAQEQYLRHGIKLDKSQMTKNPGRKQLAKMMLNSLWGKFAERAQYSEYVKYSNPEEYRHLETRMLNCEIDIMYTDFHQEEQGYCIIRPFKQGVGHLMKSGENTHVGLAAYVTAYGRLELWSQMDLLGGRVLYHDTDSIIYEHDPLKYNIPEGRYLGEWEDECPNQPLVKFVSLGPKTYAYANLGEKSETCTDGLELKDGIHPLQYYCKAKGFTINCSNVDKINFDSMHALVLDKDQKQSTPNRVFVYDRNKGQMKTVLNIKILKRTYDKGIIAPDFKIYPFGADQFVQIS